MCLLCCDKCCALLCPAVLCPAELTGLVPKLSAADCRPDEMSYYETKLVVIQVCIQACTCVVLLSVPIPPHAAAVQ